MAGFLAAMKKTEANTTTTTAEVKKVNPLLKKANPLASAQKTTTEGTGAPVLAKKPLPVLKKKPVEETTAAVETKTTEVAPTEVETAKQKAINDVKKELVKEALEETVTEPTETPVVATETDKNAEEEEIVEPVVVETKEESKAKTIKRNNSRSKKTPKVEKNAQETELVEVFHTQISYADALTAISSPFVDAEWEEFKEALSMEFNEIEITSDMNAATMKQALADLSALRSKIWFDFQAIKTNYEALSTDKPEGIIARTKMINIGEGSNELQRKKAGVLACMNYTPIAGGEPINLYEVLDETRSRYNFLKNLLDGIKYKTDSLITMSSALKLEGQHLGAEV